MKKVLLNILIGVVAIALIIFIIWFFNGSLEMYPTQEQQEKTRIITGIGIFISLSIEIFLIAIKVKKS